MGSFLIGAMLMVAGLFVSFIPPFFWGIPIFIIGIFMMFSGSTRTSISAVQTAIAVGKNISHAPDNKTSGLTTSATTLVIPEYDAAKWKTLKEFDDDIKAAAMKLDGLGDLAEARLAAAYLSVMDKSMLDVFVTKIHDEESRRILEEAKADEQRRLNTLREEEDEIVERSFINGHDYIKRRSGTYEYFDKQSEETRFFQTYDEIREALFQIEPEK